MTWRLRENCCGTGSECAVARARELVAEGDQATAAARIDRRQAIIAPTTRPPAAGPGRPGTAIVEIDQTDGTREPSPRASWVSLLTEAGTADHAHPSTDAWSGATSPTRILPGETAGRVIWT